MLYIVVGEPATGQQVGVHAGDGRVCGDHCLHDGLCSQVVVMRRWEKLKTREKQIAAFLLAFKGIEGVASTIQAEDGRSLTVGDVFKNAIFRDIMLSLLATLRLYIIASIIFISPFLSLFLWWLGD